MDQFEEERVSGGAVIIAFAVIAASAFIMGVLTGGIYHRLYPILMGWLGG